MLCVVVPEVEDGDFSHLKGSALNVHSSVIEEWQGRKTCFERVPAPERFFPQKTHRSDQTSQHKGQKIFDSSRTFQSKIHPNGPELVLEENQNPTVFERLECVAKFLRASPTVPLIALFWLDDVRQWHVWILLRIPVARILWDFDFLRGLAPGRLDGFSIGRYEKNRKSFDLYAVKFEIGAMRFLGEKLLRR